MTGVSAHISHLKHDIIADLVLSADQGTPPSQEQESDLSAVSSPQQGNPQAAVEAETSHSSASSSDSTTSDHNTDNANDKGHRNFWKQLRRLCSRSLLVCKLCPELMYKAVPNKSANTMFTTGTGH